MKDLIHRMIAKFPTSRMQPAVRISLNRVLLPMLKQTNRGKTLEIGANPEYNYRSQVSATEYLTLDSEKEKKPDLLGDAHAIKWKSNYFDSVIAIEVLEHLRDPQQAINEMWRVLKPGGTCLISTRFIYPYHPGPNDYYRFTWDSLEHLFRKFKQVEIKSQGNRIEAAWVVLNSGSIGVILNLLNPIIGRLPFKNKYVPTGYVVLAKK